MTYLVVGRVDAGWVVCTSVKDDNGTLGCGLQVFNHTVKVKAGCGLVPVAIFPDFFKARVLEDHPMISPENIGGIYSQIYLASTKVMTFYCELQLYLT